MLAVKLPKYLLIAVLFGATIFCGMAASSSFVDLSLEDYQNAVQMEPGDAEAHYNLGLTYHLEGSDKEAAQSFEKALEINPRHQSARFMLAELYKTWGDFKKSFFHYKQLLEYQPESASLLNDTGIIYLAQKNFLDALPWLDKALKIQPDFVPAYVNRGIAYGELGEPEQAMLDFLAAKEILRQSKKNNSGVAKLIAVYAGDLNPDKFKNQIADPADLEAASKIELLKWDLAGQPRNILFHFELGLTYLKLNQLDKALAHFLKADGLYGGSIWVQNAIGEVYFRKGMMQDALTVFLESLKINPNVVETYINLGRLYDLLGDGVKAIHYMGEAKKLVEGSARMVSIADIDSSLETLCKKYPEVEAC